MWAKQLQDLAILYVNYDGYNNHCQFWINFKVHVNRTQWSMQYFIARVFLLIQPSELVRSLVDICHDNYHSIKWLDRSNILSNIHLLSLSHHCNLCGHHSPTHMILRKMLWCTNSKTIFCSKLRIPFLHNIHNISMDQMVYKTVPWNSALIADKVYHVLRPYPPFPPPPPLEINNGG